MGTEGGRQIQEPLEMPTWERHPWHLLFIAAQTPAPPGRPGSPHTPPHRGPNRTPARNHNIIAAVVQHSCQQHVAGGCFHEARMMLPCALGGGTNIKIGASEGMCVLASLGSPPPEGRSPKA